MKKNVFATENTYFSVQQSLEFVGNGSNYQKRAILILSFTQMFFSFIIMGLPFLFLGPIFLCNGEQCEEFQFCKDPQANQIQQNFPLSLTNSFQLWCDRNYFIGLSGTLLFSGQVLSGFVFPYISAIKGRKTSIVLTQLVSGISLTFSAIANSFYLFLIAMVLTGLGSGAFENEAFVYISEISGYKFRNFAQVILNSVWAIAQVLFALFLQYLDNWRIIVIALVGLPLIISSFLICMFIFESPRYLVAEKRFNEARDVLDQIAILNNRPHFQYSFEGEEDADNQFRRRQRNVGVFKHEVLIEQNEIAFSQSVSYSYVDLFRYKSLKKVSFLLMIMWVFRYQIYYGLAFSMNQLGDDLSDNFFFVSISEVLACLLTATIKLKFKRIMSMTFFAILSASFSILMSIPRIPLKCFHLTESCPQKILQILFAMLVKFSITIFGDILITYTTEVYPTVVRSHGLGLQLTAGKVGIVLMPMFLSILSAYRINPLFVFGVVGVGVVLSVQKLPETINTKLADYIDETIDQEKPVIEMHQLQQQNNSNFN